MAVQGYTNDYTGQLTSSYTSGGTSLVVNSVAGLPPTGTIFYLKVENEYFKCTSYATLTLTVVGAQGGTAASNHASGTAITACWILPDVLDGIRADQSAIGTYANLPATTNRKSGDRYRQTDGPYEFIFDGTLWQPFIGGTGQLIVPPSTGWSWDNQGSATIDLSRGYHHLATPRKGSVNLVERYRTAPATPYTINALMRVDLSGLDTPATTSFDNCGINVIFRDGSTGKMVEFRLGSASSAAEITFAKWTNSTTFSAAYSDTTAAKDFAYKVVPFRMPIWFQLKDDGTNISAAWSIDGFNFTTYDTRLRTDFLASGPTQVGWGCYNNGDGVQIDLLSWG